MKVVEIMKLGRNLLEVLQDSCIKVSDTKYIDMYEEYERIVSSGEKSTYAVTFLSEKYNISERQVYYIIQRFSKDCKICAAV